MSRTLPGGMSTDLAANGTAPRYLCEIGFSPALYFYSGSGDITYDNSAGSPVLWTGNGFSVTALQSDKAGVMTASLEIPNHDSSFSAIVLATSTLDPVPVEIHYREGSNTVKIFDGFVAGYPSIGQRVAINCTNQNTHFTMTPRLAIAPPLFNHVIPSGTVIAWGSRHIKIGRPS